VEHAEHAPTAHSTLTASESQPKTPRVVWAASFVGASTCASHGCSSTALAVNRLLGSTPARMIDASRAKQRSPCVAWCVKSRRGLTQKAIDEAGSLGRQVGVGRILEHSAFHRRQALLIRLPCRHQRMRLAADTGAPHALLRPSGEHLTRMRTLAHHTHVQDAAGQQRRAEGKSILQIIILATCASTTSKRTSKHPEHQKAGGARQVKTSARDFDKRGDFHSRAHWHKKAHATETGHGCACPLARGMPTRVACVQQHRLQV
jgi:hypothetical protein